MGKTELVVCGAAGKMGVLIIELAQKNETLAVKTGIEAKGSPLVGKQILGVDIADNLEDAISGEEVVIDFTVPSFTAQALHACAGKNTPIVIGTTGLSKEQYGEMENISEKIPVFFAPNMSFGVNLFFEIIRQASPLLKDYDVEISEIHHRFKKDAPSGTAKKIGEIICETSGRDFDKAVKFGRHGIVGPRTKEEICIHSIRAGDIVGEHYVYFGGTGEVIELSHRCYNRQAFASGALKAAIFLKGKKPGLYGMRDLIKDRAKNISR